MLHSMIIDDFSDRFHEIRNFADSADFSGYTNPVDGVVYPGICDDVPDFDVIERLKFVIGDFESHVSFMRLSVDGCNPPHWAHHDGIMGKYSMMLYLNRKEHCAGGTALLEHVDGDPSPEVWARDTNRPDSWRTNSVCQMKPNRAFIFRSSLWHAALPMGGFGKDATDGRLLYTVFCS